MPGIKGAITDGSSQAWEFHVTGSMTLRLSGTAGPYDIDIETKHKGQPDSAYSRIDPLDDFGTITVTDTEEHLYESNQILENLRVTVTNNAGERITVDGVVGIGGEDEYFIEDHRRWIPAKNVSGVVYPKASKGIRGIQRAHDAADPDQHLVLELTGTYSGAEQLTLDGHPTGGSARNVTVRAHGAEIDYTGTGNAIRMVKTNSINPGRVRWLGGFVGGPGSGTAGPVGFSLADAARFEVAPDQIDGFDTGIELRNEDQYCEMSHFHNFRLSDYNTGLDLLTDTDTGGSGTKSFRGTLIENIVAEAPGDTYCITMSQDAGFYASEIKHIHSAVPSATDVTVHLQGNQANSRINDVRGETGGSGTPGTVVQYENITNAPEECKNISTTGSGTTISIPTTEPFNDGDSFTANRAFYVGRSSAPPTPGDGGAVLWLDTSDFDLKVTFANGNTFTVQTNT